MRKILFITMIFISVNSFTQTTLEEWNYITKGYKIQLESGLDMKKGYELIFDKKQSEGKTQVNFYFLRKTSINKNVAIMVYVPSANAYYCIPKLGDEQVNDLFNKQMTTLIKNSPITTHIIIWQMTNYLNY